MTSSLATDLLAIDRSAAEAALARPLEVAGSPTGQARRVADNVA